MTGLLRPFLDRWRLCALLASAAMLAIAHGFQTFGGFAPCTLCLRQATCWILAAVFIWGAGTAIYHAGAEWKFWPGPKACSGAGGGGVDVKAMTSLLHGARIRPPACDEAPWVFLGLSMAGWNALISLALAGLSAAAALRERSKR